MKPHVARLEGVEAKERRVVVEIEGEAGVWLYSRERRNRGMREERVVLMLMLEVMLCDVTKN